MLNKNTENMSKPELIELCFARAGKISNLQKMLDHSRQCEIQTFADKTRLRMAIEKHCRECGGETNIVNRRDCEKCGLKKALEETSANVDKKTKE